MLGRLLKHEFRATGRIMLPLIAAELLVSVLAGLSVRGLARMQSMSFLHTLYIMTLVVFGLGLFAIAVVAFVLMIQRFYKSLLRDEGYLSMTLPVTVDAHIWAKLLTSFVWFAAVGLLSMAAIFVVMRIGTDVSWAPFYGMEWDESVFNFERIGGGSIALYILEAVILAFLYAAATCLHCYAAGQRRGLQCLGPQAAAFLRGLLSHGHGTERCDKRPGLLHPAAHGRLA